MDVGHSSARNSQAATLAAASGNVLLFTMTDTKTNAWLKETALVERALDFAINTEKLDVCMIEIDDNAKNASIISSYKRINGPPDNINEPVRAGIDVFHAAKAMGKHIAKITAENLIVLEKFFKPICEKNYRVSDIMGKLDEMMLCKSNDFFTVVTTVFSYYGATAWKKASETPTTMRRFAESNNLIDKLESHSYWEPVLTAWNKVFPAKQSITSISKVRISISMSAKNIRVLATSVEVATRIPIVTENIGNEKDELFMYMKSCLPESCCRGNNFSIDLSSITDDAKNIINGWTLRAEVLYVDPDEDIMLQTFASAKRTMQEVKKLKTEKLTILSRHLATKMDTAAPITALEKKRFCILNYWRINNVWEDVHEAMTIAQRAFIARLGEFKRTMKNLLRVVNEQFGDWSMKFKMCFLINGLLNFAYHYSDKHEDCARYFWWTQCGDRRTNYMPTQDYCTALPSGRGPQCRQLIPGFFKLFVTAFVMSKYAEMQFWKCLCFSKTTICESYFHWKVS
jgi:hypothetical protein